MRPCARPAAEALTRYEAAVADAAHNEVSAAALIPLAVEVPEAADEARSVVVDAARNAAAVALNPLAAEKPAAVSAAAAHNAAAGAVHAEHPAEAFRAVRSFAFADAQASSCHAGR